MLSPDDRERPKLRVKIRELETHIREQAEALREANEALAEARAWTNDLKAELRDGLSAHAKNFEGSMNQCICGYCELARCALAGHPAPANPSEGETR